MSRIHTLLKHTSRPAGDAVASLRKQRLASIREEGLQGLSFEQANDKEGLVMTCSARLFDSGTRSAAPEVCLVLNYRVFITLHKKISFITPKYYSIAASGLLEMLTDPIQTFRTQRRRHARYVVKKN